MPSGTDGGTASLVEIRRSDTVDNDVSASKRHLNERAEERRGSEAEGRNSNANGDGRQHSNVVLGTSTEQTITPVPAPAPPATAATAEVGGREGAQGVEKREVPPGLAKQSSIIKAERTDNASWDVSGQSVSSLCCFGRTKKTNR